MDRTQLILFGIIASIIGCLTIVLTWTEFYYEDYYGYIDFTYSGVSLITSGDFTDPDGIFYGAGLLGVYTPLLICIAFFAMTLRYVVHVNRCYFKDVLACSILIIIASIYMIYWVGPGNRTTEYYIATTNFGAGPIAAMAMAAISAALAHTIDSYDPATTTCCTNDVPDCPGPDGLESTYSSAVSKYAFYCPQCGRGFNQEEISSTKYCKYCGACLEENFQQNFKNNP